MCVVAGFDQRALVVEIHEQVVRVAGEQQLGGALVLQLETIAAIGVHHGADEIGAGGAQRRRLLLRRVDRRSKLQVIGRRYLRRLIVGQTGQAEPDALELQDRPVLEGRQRRAARIAQVRGVERESGFAHPLEEYGLAEVELVVARHQDVRRDHVGEGDDVRAMVECGHGRGREGVAAMRHDHMATFRRSFCALRLDHGGKPREPAAPAPVGKCLLAHDVEVVEQHEGDLRAVGRLRPRGPPCQQRQGRGERGEK